MNPYSQPDPGRFPARLFTPFRPETSSGSAPAWSARARRVLVRGTIACAGLSLLTGCLGLEPAADTTRFFVLPPVAAEPGREAAEGRGRGPALGLGPVNVPEYLRTRRVAVHLGPAEISYPESLEWVEPLDQGIERLLATYLAPGPVPAEIHRPAWRRDDVQAEIHVDLFRFDTDARGRVELDARWRITDPGAEKTLSSGAVGVVRQGPSFAEDPGGAVTTLGGALAALGADIEAAVRRVAARSSARREATD